MLPDVVAMHRPKAREDNEFFGRSRSCGQACIATIDLTLLGFSWPLKAEGTCRPPWIGGAFKQASIDLRANGPDGRNVGVVDLRAPAPPCHLMSAATQFRSNRAF